MSEELDRLEAAARNAAHTMHHLQLIVTEIAEGTYGVYYLSFADENGFRGGCFVMAHGVITAIERTNQLGINPGGEVACWGPVPAPEDGAMDKLLTKQEIESTKPKDPAIIDIAQERDDHDGEDTCGETNTLVDGGLPCIRFKGHPAYDGQRNHITESGMWWA